MQAMLSQCNYCEPGLNADICNWLLSDIEIKSLLISAEGGNVPFI